MRSAPTGTNLLAWAKAKYSGSRVTSPLCELIVTSPRQLPQPPRCGPCFSSRARFHITTPLAQLRVVPIIRLRTAQLNDVFQSPLQFPLAHSVNQTSLYGKRSRTTDCAVTSPA